MVVLSPGSAFKGSVSTAFAVWKYFSCINPISGWFLATPISGKGGLFRTPPWDLRFLPVDF